MLRRIGAAALAAVMTLALTVPSFAADTGTLTISNAVQGGEYKVYSVMTATVAGDLSDAAYTYKLNDNPAMQKKIMNGLVSGGKFGLKAGGYGDDGKEDGLLAGFELHNGTVSFRVESKKEGDTRTPDQLYKAWYGESESDRTPEATAFLYRFSDELRAAVEDAAKGGDPEAVLGKPFATKKADASGVVTIEDMPYGYFMVISPMGQWAMTATVPGGDGNAAIYEKNSVPTVSKRVFDTATGKFLSDNDKAIGDELWYKAVIDTGTGIDHLMFTDTMDPGLTFDKLLSISFYPRQSGAKLEGDAKFTFDKKDGKLFREAYKTGNEGETNYDNESGYRQRSDYRKYVLRLQQSDVGGFIWLGYE